MAKNSVLGKPTYQAHLPRQGFNMSQKLKFTSATGQLLPVYFDILNPSEKISCKFDLFSRTQELAKPAMVDIDEYVELFFVPIKKLYAPFQERITAVDDFGSMNYDSLYSVSQSQRVLPALDLSFMVDETDEYVYPNAIYQGATSVYGQSFDGFYAGACRLLDHLGIPFDQLLYWGDQQSFEEHAVQNYTFGCSPLMLLAYQAIYFDYYRLSNWESNQLGAYVVDDIPPKYNIMTQRFKNSKGDSVRQMFSLRYRPYQRDYFKAIEPSPLLQSTSVLGELYPSILPNVSFSTNFSPELKAASSSSTASSSLDSASTLSLFGLSGSNSQHSLSTLRSAYAWEKMLKIQARAGQHYDDQILAHYGFKVPKGIGNEVYFLGSHHQQIHIGEVISTAETADGALGALAGKGYSGTDREHRQTFEFTAPCHGVLMAIYSCVPRPTYSTGLDKLNTKLGRYDFYQPEFADLGMQPMYQYEFYARGYGSITPTSRAAWQYRYMEFKTKYDRNTLAFGHGYGYNAGPFASWTIGQRANTVGGYTGMDCLLCTPDALDSIMLNIYDYPTGQDIINGSAATVLYASDPLIHDLEIECYKVSPMSTYGLEV